MPTSYTARSVPTTSWSARPVAGDSLLYDSGELYDNDYFYDGTLIPLPTYSTRTVPSAPTWNTRTTP